MRQGTLPGRFAERHAAEADGPWRASVRGHAAAGLYLPCISPASPLHLPCISPVQAIIWERSWPLLFGEDGCLSRLESGQLTPLTCTAGTPHSEMIRR